MLNTTNKHTEIGNAKNRRRKKDKYTKHQCIKIVNINNKFEGAIKIPEFRHMLLLLTYNIMECSFFRTTIREIQQRFVQTGSLLSKILQILRLDDPLFLKLCHDFMNTITRSLKLVLCLMRTLFLLFEHAFKLCYTTDQSRRRFVQGHFL